MFVHAGNTRMRKEVANETDCLALMSLYTDLII